MRSDKPSECASGVCGDEAPPVVGSVLTGTGLTIAQAAARLERGEKPPLSDVQRAIVERWLAERPIGLQGQTGRGPEGRG
ncbi:MAG: hypothetical protein H0W03_03175 [Solirubrobacterales bacterium]|jgi:hypothetical protein|nr:hypothetical protein [Solirubrobacterales bacterium]